MNHFPVSSSILSAEHLGTFLETAYGLGGRCKSLLIKAGINHTYQVETDTGKYVFRVYSLNWRTKEEILEEIRLLQHLHNEAIPVSYPVQDTSGSYIQELYAPEGTRYGVLFSYAAGEKLMDAPAELHNRLGRLMAQMHQCTQDFPLKRVTYDVDLLLGGTLEALTAFLPADSAEMQFMSRARQYLMTELRNTPEGSVRSGAVHLDLWFDNMVIGADGDITLFDFDFCGNGWLCTDIAYYLMQLYTLTPDAAAYAAKAQAFVDGYEAVTPLSAEEKRLLPLLGVGLYFFYLKVQCSRFENWSNLFINEVYLKRYIVARVKPYYDFHFGKLL
jgi:Ser/Thr protein kinase RdoA (MazF antagonist)